MKVKFTAFTTFLMYTLHMPNTNSNDDDGGHKQNGDGFNSVLKFSKDCKMYKNHLPFEMGLTSLAMVWFVLGLLGKSTNTA